MFDKSCAHAASVVKAHFADGTTAGNELEIGVLLSGVMNAMQSTSAVYHTPSFDKVGNHSELLFVGILAGYSDRHSGQGQFGGWLTELQ